VKAGEAAADEIRELSRGVGASLVVDLVGTEPTVALAAQVIGFGGQVSVVGIGGGALPVGFGSIANDAAVTPPYWGSAVELMEVLDLARQNRLTAEVETFSLDDAPTAYQRMRDGQLRGRAVITP
jgi:alcohol dehydrogenase, propanol-preferring